MEKKGTKTDPYQKSSQVSSYFSELIKKVKIDPNTKEKLDTLTSSLPLKIYNKTGIKKPPSNSSLRPLIESLASEFSAANFEESLRKARMLEIKRERNHLEAKLSLLNSSIEKTGLSEEPRYIRPNLQIEKFRRDYYEEERRKSEENAKKLREYHSEQKRRQQLTEQHLHNITELLEEDRAESLKRLKETKKKFVSDYKKQLQIMRKNTKERKKELVEIKNRNEEFREIIREKPLFQKMQEKYSEEIVMKELEKRKAELAKKREIFQPLDRNDIVEHMKKHDSLIKTKEKSLNAIHDEQVSHRSRIFEELRRKEREKKMEEEELEKSRQKRLESKKKYGEVIREMYSPSIDKFKQMEIALRIEKMNNPVIKKKFNYENSFIAQSESELKKVKKKRKVESVTPVVERKKIDYLAEIRKNRKEYEIENIRSDIDWQNEVMNSSSNSAKAKILQKKAKILEQKVKRAELSLTEKSQGIVENINFSERLNKMLISSIKAKLEVMKLSEDA